MAAEENKGLENRSVALRLLGAARDVHLARQQGGKYFGSRFRAGTTLDLVAAGERAGLLPTAAYDRRRQADAVEWLRARDAIEVDPYLRRMVGGAIHRITARGLGMLEEGYPGEPYSSSVGEEEYSQVHR